MNCFLFFGIWQKGIFHILIFHVTPLVLFLSFIQILFFFFNQLKIEIHLTASVNLPRLQFSIQLFFTRFFLHSCFPFLCCALPSQRWHCHILKHLSLGWQCFASLCFSVSILLRTTQRDDMLVAHPGWVARLQERCGWQDQPSTDYGSNACRQCKTSPLETCRKSNAGNSE